MEKNKYILGVSLLVAFILVLSPLAIARSATENAGNMNAGKDNGAPLGPLAFLWECNLTISEPGGNTDVVSFGEDTLAYDGSTGPGPSGSDAYDAKHAPAPPSEPYMYAFFDDGLVGNSWEKMSRDFRNGPDTYKVWNLTVEWHNSSFTYIPQITIAWNTVELATEYTSVELWNMTGTPTMVADMLTQSSYTYDQGWIYVDPPGIYFWVPAEFEIRCEIGCVTTFSEDFEGLYGTRPGFSDGWLIEDTDGMGYISGVYAYDMWGSYYSSTYAHSGTMMARMDYDYATPYEDWLFTECLDLSTGIPYALSFWYRGSSSATLQDMEVWIGTSQSSTGMTTLLWSDDAISNEYLKGEATVSVSSDDTYYIGFLCQTDTALNAILYLDDINLEIPPDDDVGVTSINEPAGSYLGGTYTPEVTVKNFGINDQTSVPVHMEIFKKDVTGAIEDFEADDGGYIHSGPTDLWAWGTPTSGPTSAHSGTNCWGTNLGGIYDNYANAMLDSISISVPSVNPALQFWHWYDTENSYDGGNVKISTDGGTIWNILGSYLDPYNDDAAASGNAGIPLEPCFTGHNQGYWEKVSFDLSGYAGQTVNFRWHFGSDSSVGSYPGWYIDDVAVVEINYISDYDQTVSVDLLSGESKDLTFPDWTPATPTVIDIEYKIVACTELIGDEVPANDCQEEMVTVGFYHDVGTVEITSPYYGGLGGKGSTFYCENLHDYVPGPGNNICSFDSDIPGTLTVLGMSTAGDFLAGGCFVEDVWYACEYSTVDSNIWQVDETDGTLTLVGASGALLNGIAYDPAGTLYGCSGTDLYTIDTATGVATLVGAMGNTGATMIGIACDGDGNMYGVDIVDDNLYSIDTSTGVATLIGPLGVDLSYAQDIAYDIDEDTLYSTGYKGSTMGGGALYSVNTATGTMTFIADFPIGALGCPSEIANLAIPYTIGDLPQGIAGIIPVEAIVENFGDFTETFDVHATITREDTAKGTVVYDQTVTVTGLGSGLQATLNFPDWDATGEEADFKIEVVTLLPGDDTPGNNDQRYRFALIAEAPPTADANGPYYANIGNSWTVTFDGSASHDNDGGGAPPEISSYLWDFGDGTTGTGMNPTHTYEHPEHSSQTLTVTLTVWDNDAPAEQDTTTTEVIIAPDDDDPPIVQLEYPRGGEQLSGTVKIQWYAVDSEDWGSPSLTLQYSNDGGSSWKLIAKDLVNTIGDADYKDRGEYSWNTGSLPAGNYMVKILAYDTAGNVAKDKSGPCMVGTGAGILVSYVNVETSSNYIRNGDSLTINAGITFGQHISAEYVTADLSGLGKGTSVPADSYDGLTATWTITDVACAPSDGPIAITVTATDGATTDSNTATLIADNTIPELNVISPENALYFRGAKLFALNKPVIIGALTLKANANDLSGIEKTEIYIDNELKETFANSCEWNMNLKLMGRHTLKIVTYDNAENTKVYSQIVRIYNPFGEK
jgi:hypothetical protein